MKIEVITFIELNILNRRYFLIYLFNIFINKPVRTVFLNIKNNYHIYKDDKLRV